MTKLMVEASIQIQKPPHTVYEAIVDPEKMSNYFISKGSARLETGKTIMWRFPEFDLEFPVRVEKTLQDQYVSFHWDVDGEELLVEITLTPRDDSTVVNVTEKSRTLDEAGLKWLKGNTEGWANCLACLKAYLEYGVNLRKGAFDYRFS